MMGQPPRSTVAPDTTVTRSLVADQLLGVALVPLNVTVLVPWLPPRLLAPTSDLEPPSPLVCVLVVSDGVMLNVSPIPLPAIPLFVSMTLPTFTPNQTCT